MIYLDFSKAFDSVDHAILYQKLYAHGLRGSVLLWFKDYLTDRCQRVVLDNSLLNGPLLHLVCPRGAFWGHYCLQYLLILCLIPYHLDHKLLFMQMIQKYFGPITSLVDSMALQPDLNNLEVWSNKNSIQFNPS